MEVIKLTGLKNESLQVRWVHNNSLKGVNKARTWSSGRPDRRGHLEGLIQSGRIIQAWLKEQGHILGEHACLRNKE